MRTRVTFCDSCAASMQIRLAKGYYITDEGKRWDVCTTHLKKAVRHGFDIDEFETLGDIEMLVLGTNLFKQKGEQDG